MTVEPQYSFADLPPEIVLNIAAQLDPYNDPRALLPLLLTTRKLGYLKRFLYKNILCLLSTSDDTPDRQLIKKAQTQCSLKGKTFNYHHTTIITHSESLKRLLTTLFLHPHLLHYIGTFDVKVVNFHLDNKSMYKRLNDIFGSYPKQFKQLHHSVPTSRAELEQFAQKSYRDLLTNYSSCSHNTFQLFQKDNVKGCQAPTRGSCLYAPRDMTFDDLNCHDLQFLDTMEAVATFAQKSSTLKDKLNMELHNLNFVMEPSVDFSSKLRLPQDYFVSLSFTCFTTNFQ